MPSSRRRFLTGRMAADAAREAGERLADAIEATQRRPLPQSGETVRLETQAMACPWAVILNPGPPERVLTASQALDEVHRVEALLTVYRADSPVSKLNREAASGPCAVTPELFELLDQCDTLRAATAGAFDPASQALIALWQRARSENRLPEQPEIDLALAASGLRYVRRENRQTEGGETCGVAFDVAGLGLNFGAIGKGYAIDRAATVLRDGGIDDFLVHGGHSSLLAAGEHYGQGGWPVGLKNPLFTEESYLTLLLSDQALGTSGSNIQYFRHQGRRYGHLLDPRNGWPAEEFLSVSVVAPSATEADALSTAFYVLGLENSLKYCDTHKSVGAILTPPAERGRKLHPVVCNLPADRIFLTTDDVALQFWSFVEAGPKPPGSDTISSEAPP
ncbi:MAG: FAD:protein FMN transferase [Planctomycetaceae bacterium]